MKGKNMITIDTPNIKIGLRVRSEHTGNEGHISVYDKNYIQHPHAPEYNAQGWMEIIWDHGGKSCHYLYDPDYGERHGRGAMFSCIEIIDPTWKE
jgi:hypothetical protein